jgi:hypothetical protein
MAQTFRTVGASIFLILFALVLIVTSIINISNLNSINSTMDEPPAGTSALLTINILILIGAIIYLIYLIVQTFIWYGRRQDLKKQLSKPAEGFIGKGPGETVANTPYFSIGKVFNNLSGKTSESEERDYSIPKDSLSRVTADARRISTP